ncbi:TRAM domain-containing protein [Fervidicoccus fontis]|jgi:predicted RNA-binding protein with TRAM domain|uniref:TRAM domain-containing protein n=2 Tax=Fervidicoccus fontis TaxID=683846 RepID=I0A310_FERFK|nr:TRAM domain-containing protein [Fervidicoccus fontis]AFH43367.1 hypothetical protein FFONT_1379 [Fervidicoccus fontis Kam940]MBE9390744.1 TRAM domain-containing protein [Fervidicoccus fontis]
MTKYRDHKEVYTRDYSRWSVYPKIPKPEEYQAQEKLRPGSEITIEIRDIDEKGRGVGYYNRTVIRVNGGGTVGDKVRVKITERRDNEAYADIVEWLQK